MRQLPPDLFSKMSQNLQTIGNNANPNMKVIVARAKDTVADSTYWSVETIRETSGLGDVSVAPRRLKTHGRPDRIYEIHVRDNQVYTSIREYPDKLREGFKTQFSLGSGTSVAIAFNGDWERYRKLWRLLTDDKPWIFWVDGSGILWRQHWDDGTTKEQLDVGVKRVRAIRAWKNVNFADKDQGIVVGYVKMDGTVWYRNYCQQADSSYIWENARQVLGFTGVAASLNLFITNDYRMGFIIESNDSKIHWLITPRNWAGMGSPTEAIVGELVDLNFDVTGIKTHLVGLGNEKVAAEDIVGAVMQNYIHEPEQLSSAVGRLKMYVCPPIISPMPDIVSVERLGYTDRQTISITFNYPLECDLDNLKSRFSLKTQSNAIIGIDNITQNGSTLFIKTIEPMKLMDNLILTFYDIGAYFLAVRVDETCVIDYGKIIELSILGSPPEVKENVTVFMDVMFKVTELGTLETLLEENLTGAVTNLNFTVIEVDTRYGMVEEKLASSVANIVFTVTQTSTSPV